MEIGVLKEEMHHLADSLHLVLLQEEYSLLKWYKTSENSLRNAAGGSLIVIVA